MHNFRCGCVFAQERNMPQRAKANAVLPRVMSWADVYCISLGCKLSGFPSSSSQLILQPADLDTKSLASPMPPQPCAFGYGSPATKGAVVSDPLPLPANPAQHLGDQAEAQGSVRQPRCILFVWSSHSASSQAIFRCISRAQQLFL